MKRSSRLWATATIAIFVLLLPSPGAHAGIPWNPTTIAERVMNRPRTWSNNQMTVANQISGSTYPGLNTVATSSGGTAATNYIHYVGEPDGAGGGVDYNDLPGRTFAYP